MIEEEKWPVVYDVSTDSMRKVKQEDVDRLYKIANAYWSLTEMVANHRNNVRDLVK